MPGSLLEQIGMPLSRAIHNLGIGIEAIDRENALAAEAPEVAEEDENADADV